MSRRFAGLTGSECLRWIFRQAKATHLLHAPLCLLVGRARSPLHRPISLRGRTVQNGFALCSEVRRGAACGPWDDAAQVAPETPSGESDYQS